MKELTEKDVEFMRGTVHDVMVRNKINRWSEDLIDAYLVEVRIPVSVGTAKAVGVFNEMFHALGVLPEGKTLSMDEGGDYCAIFGCEDGKTFSGLYNFPFAKDFKEGDEEYQFTLKAKAEAQERDGEEEEAEMLELVDGIKAGRLKVKSPDGYLVLAGEFYDRIASGEKTVEYRDFTEYNIKRTIGLKTVRFNRGYGSKGKPPKQMKWEVEKVVLMDYDGNECNPFNVPDGFWPTTVAIHLGKRIG